MPRLGARRGQAAAREGVMKADAATSAKATSWTASMMPPASASPNTVSPQRITVTLAAVEVVAITGTASPCWKARALARNASTEASTATGSQGEAKPP
jgi:hypothetical protein